jgi:hypothetical protein
MRPERPVQQPDNAKRLQEGPIFRNDRSAESDEERYESGIVEGVETRGGVWREGKSSLRRSAGS